MNYFSWKVQQYCWYIMYYILFGGADVVVLGSRQFKQMGCTK